MKAEGSRRQVFEAIKDQCKGKLAVVMIGLYSSNRLIAMDSKNKYAIDAAPFIRDAFSLKFPLDGIARAFHDPFTNKKLDDQAFADIVQTFMGLNGKNSHFIAN